jgi:hypothetical protein
MLKEVESSRASDKLSRVIAPQHPERVNVHQSTSTTLKGDEVLSELWSVDAVQTARQKLARSGRNPVPQQKSQAMKDSDSEQGNVTFENNGHSNRRLNSQHRSKSADRLTGYCSGNHLVTPPPSLPRNSSSQGSMIGSENFGYFTSDRHEGEKGTLATDVSLLDTSSTPQKLTKSFEETPKSILRHRQIVDRHVHVESKFEHTPTTEHHRRKHRRGLNFSYTDVDDSKLFGHKTKSVNFKIASASKQDHCSPEKSQPDDLTAKRPVRPDRYSGASTVVSETTSDQLPSSQRFYYSSQDSVCSSNGIASKSLDTVTSEVDSFRRPTKAGQTVLSSGNLSVVEDRTSDQLPSSHRFYYESSQNSINPSDMMSRLEHGNKSTRTGTDPCQGKSIDAVQSMATDHPSNSRIQNGTSSSLLLQTGNDRKNARIVRELENRSQSSIFSMDPNSSDMNRSVTSHDNSRLSNSSLSKSHAEDIGSRQFSKLLAGRHEDPLLGYDWIAGNLDNERTLDSIPDEFFDEVREFRRRNRDACVGSLNILNCYEPSRPLSPEIQNPTHTCIHGYTVNNRLFTEPVNVNASGNSVCPVCFSSRKHPTAESPGFVRVSIPQSTVAKPYKVKPHRRRSFDETDSCALSQHCLAGWECSSSLTSNVPTASSLDLKHATNGLRSQMTATEEEVQKMAETFSRTSRLVHDYPPPPVLIQRPPQQHHVQLNGGNNSILKPVPRNVSRSSVGDLSRH